MAPSAPDSSSPIGVENGVYLLEQSEQDARARLFDLSEAAFDLTLDEDNDVAAPSHPPLAHDSPHRPLVEALLLTVGSFKSRQRSMLNKHSPLPGWAIYRLLLLAERIVGLAEDGLDAGRSLTSSETYDEDAPPFSETQLDADLLEDDEGDLKYIIPDGAPAATSVAAEAAAMGSPITRTPLPVGAHVRPWSAVGDSEVTRQRWWGGYPAASGQAATQLRKDGGWSAYHLDGTPIRSGIETDPAVGEQLADDTLEARYGSGVFGLVGSR